ncbi:MAG: metal-dependent hydrolase [Candidatus Korarchaeota archaeon]|nr:metal-dependent hydrolase [Thermoproteota archaeon]MCR8463031.1 metal-dependent hydrolase [Thermoproteota archaeon]MCR8471173.1 metal-dependent hydrolase [Thermoproteota archaeon]MCR8471577.1 metal-dependent hydrolase [Thermoproteota archaeon]MCR8473069.1 metal-dependent hydrolase [Thermoproteota archaeon]
MGYVKWYGHAAFEIKVDDKVVLIDPWIKNPKSPLKYINELPKIDLIIVTHDHNDHLGETVEIAKKFNSSVVTTFELANEMRGQGIDSIGANIGGPIKAKDLTIILTPAVHSSTAGSPTGVIIRGSEASIYHAGDTGVFATMELIGKMYSIDIALLPIGGHFTMGPYEAAWATKMINPKVVIPMHYGTFPVISGSPEEFEKYLKTLGVSTRLVVLKPGEKYEF